MATIPEGWELDETPAAPVPAAAAPVDVPDAAPKVPEGWVLDEADQPDQQPDAPAPLVDPVSTAFKAKVGLSDPLAPAIESDRAEQARREALVREAFKPEPGLSPELADAKVANYFGVSLEIVKANRESWLSSYAKDSGDPKKWINDYPLSARLIFEHPELADDVVSKKERNILFKAADQVLDWSYDFTQRPTWASAEDLAAFDAEKAAQLEGRKQRDAPTQVVESDTPEARAIREQGTIAIARQRAKESRAGIEVSVLYSRLGLARAAGRDTTLIEAQIRDAETNAKGLALGETGAAQAVADSWAQSQSSIDVLENVAKRGGVAAGVGIVVGGVAGAIATRTPAGAFAGAVRGGSIGAKIGGAEGAAERSFVLEFGDSYKQLLTTKTDSGEQLTEEEARGGALIAASVKAGIELAELSMVMKALGPGTAIFEKGGIDAVKAALARDPGLRAMAVHAAKAWAGEGVEEVTQEATDQIVNFLVRSKHDNPAAMDAALAAAAVGNTGGALAALGTATPQSGPVFDLSKLEESGTMGLMGGLPIGVGSFVVSSGVRAVLQDRQARGATQAPAIAKLAADPDSAAMSQQLAKAIADKSAETGFPITDMHVDAGAFQRLFQTPEDASAAATELMGETGPQQLVDATQSGGRLVVPVADYIEKWGKDGVAEKLARDTATSFEGLSPAQLEERRGEIEAQAKKLAADEEAKAKAEPQAAKEDPVVAERAAELEQQYVEAGQSRTDARRAAQVVTQVVRTAVADFGKSATELFPETPITVAKGDEKTIGESQGRLNQEADWSERILAASKKLEEQPEGRARAGYFDTLTGLFNRRGFDALPQAKPGGVLVAMTSTDTKPINDKVNHVQTDRLFKALAGQVAGVDPHAGRDGTTFLFRADSAEAARSAVEAWKGQLPAGLNLSLGFGEDSTRAMADLEDQVDTGRAKGRMAEGVTAAGTDAELLGEFPHAPALPAERIGTKVDLKALKEHPELLSRGDGPALTTAIPTQVADAAAKAFASTGDFARDQFLDQATGGLIFNGRGWAALGEKAHVAAFDGIGLKKLNEQFTQIGRDQLGMSRRDAKAWGREQGNTLLRAIADSAHHMGGAGVAFSRLSGDEYAAKHDDPAVLKQFIADLQADLAAQRFDVTLPDGSKVEVPVGIRWGIGEKTYEAADSNLAERKAGAGGDADLPGSGDPDQRAGRAQGRGVLEAARLDQPGGARGLSEAQSSKVAGEVGRLNQPGDEKTPKGYIESAASRAAGTTLRIFLNQSADVSTVIHESGHAFVELMLDLAERPDAPERVQARGAAILKYLGAEKRSDITRDQHEKFADGFMTYFFEGKAPSAALTGVFTRFRTWLTSIYRSLSGMRVQLNAEVRGIFDSMLATDDELQKAVARRGPGLFQTAAEAGMSEADWAVLQDDERQAEAYASKKAEEHVLKDQLREKELWWRQQLAKETRAAGHDYEQLPARKAQVLLEGSKELDAVPLDRAAVEAIVGKPGARQLPVVDEGGAHPDDVAAFAGYPTGAQMLTAVLTLPSREVWVGREAEARMKEKHPGVLEDKERLQALIADGLNGVIEKRILRDWQALRMDIPVEGVKRAAALMTENTKLSDVIPQRALAAERKAASEKARAGVKGDRTKAQNAAKAELLNAFRYREFLKARDERDSFEERLDDMAGRKRRGKLGLGGGVFQTASDAILEALSVPIPEVAPKDVLGRLQALDGLKARMEAEAYVPGFDVDELRKILAAPPRRHRELTVRQMREVAKALQQIKKLSSDAYKVTIEQRKEGVEELAAAIAKEAEVLPDVGTAPASASAAPSSWWLSQRWEGMKASTLDPEEMFRRLGKTAYDFFWKGYLSARNAESELAERVVKFFAEKWDKLPSEMQARRYDLIDASSLPFPKDVNLGGERDRQWMWMVFLNRGNSSNLERLLGGFEWTQQQVDDFLGKNITKEEADFLQGIFDLLDKELYPKVAETYEKVNGIPPPKIQPMGIKLPVGSYRGGYFPAKFSPVASRLGRKQEAAVMRQLYDDSARASVAKGFTKERAAQFSDVIDLNWSVVPSHLAGVVHYVTHDAFVRDAARVLFNGTMENTLQRRMGLKYQQQAEAWLKVVATDRPESVKTSEDWLAITGAIRSRMVRSVLAGSLKNATEDLINPLVAIASGDIKAKYVLPAYAQACTPRGYSTMRERALKLSPELRNRHDSAVSRLRRELGDVGVAGRPRHLGKFRKLVDKHAFILQEMTDNYTSTITWEGAFRESLADEHTEAEAAEAADTKVRQLFPSRALAEQPALMRDKVAVGSLVSMFGYQMKLGNVLRRSTFNDMLAWEKAHGFEQVLAAVPNLLRATGTAMSVLFLTQVVGGMLSGRGKEPDESWGEYALRKMVVGPAGLIPIFGGAIEWGAGSLLEKALYGEVKNRPISVRNAPAMAGMQSFMKSVAKVASDADSDERVFAALNAAGVVFDQPMFSLPITRAGQYVTDVAQGDVEVRNPADFIGGIWYGARPGQPANPASLAADAIAR